jgi:serine/threonine protein kinase
MTSLPAPDSPQQSAEPKQSSLDSAERIVVKSGLATPAQATRARALIPSGTSDTAQVAKFLRTLQDQNILTGEGAHQVEVMLRQQELLPGFRLLRKLGAGGMGIVYLATHLKSGEEIALKVVSSRLADDNDFVNRFQRETHALANLRHPYLANIIESGTCGQTHYLAMEYINGPSLASLLKEYKALPEPYVLRIIRQIGESLAYVNRESGLVHRDVKPENILIHRVDTSGDLFPENDIAKLIDFGLVKTTNDDEHLTQTGMTIGTPLYMSPEQVRGEKLDCRSDVYGLGATMFHLLTGMAPFRASSPGAIMSAHLTEPVPDPGDLVPSLCPLTRKLVKTALSKSQDDRFRSFDALIKACDEAIEEVQEKNGANLRLLRKPLVIKKAPAKKVAPSGDTTGARVLSVDEDLMPTGHKPEAISNRIARKHETAKRSESGRHEQQQHQLPALTTRETRKPASAPSRPATEALVNIQTEAMRRKTEAVRQKTGHPPAPPADQDSANKLQSLKNSAAFSQDAADPVGIGVAPWAVIGITVACAIGFVVYILLIHFT